jgi:glycosyltransferase involved in cell wall biosynthesis
MEIDYITGPKTDKIFGMSKYQNEIYKRLQTLHFNVVEYKSITNTFETKYKSLFPLKKDLDSNYKPNKFTLKDNIMGNLINTGISIFENIDRYRYTNLVKKSIKNENIKHIIYQDLAYLLNSINTEKSIITCHDLIPWAYNKNRSSFWKNNIKGLRKASRIITISEFSKNEIIKYVKYPEDRIYIVPDAVDHSLYYINRDKSILKKWNIESDYKVILYVGSEEPRQNVDILIKAIARLKKQFPKIKLVKIGDSHLFGAREKLLNLINELNLQNDVIFTGYVLEEDLPKWYNAADLLVYPCAYAGFGLPPLEAMACGTPVITSNTSALPEVVGDAGIMVNPDNIEELAAEMYNVLANDGLSKDMSNMGLKRAKLFKWGESAKKTLKTYKEINVI